MRRNGGWCLRLLLAALMLTPAPDGARAFELDFGGYVGGETRIFPRKPAFEGQDDTRASVSLVAQPEFRLDLGDGDDQLTFIPFGRWDSHDNRRTHADIREANWLHVEDAWDLVVGFDQVFWGVTESRHLVDIVNQLDQVEGIDGDEKLGQPMINLNILSDYGTFRFFALPGFRERTFPSDDARLRGPLPINVNDASFGKGAGHDEVALAFRYTNSFGPFDLGLAYFHGTGRDPTLVPKAKADGSLYFEPFYELIDQASIDLQATFGDWLWKAEAITRTGQKDRINAFVGGFEYTFFDVLDTPASVGLLSEYLYDSRNELEFASIGSGAPYEDDIFLGTRLTLNDFAGTQLLAGVIVDREDGSTAASLEASRRLTDHWLLEIDARGFFNVAKDDVLKAAGNDDYIALRVKRFF